MVPVFGLCNRNVTRGLFWRIRNLFDVFSRQSSHRIASHVFLLHRRNESQSISGLGQSHQVPQTRMGTREVYEEKLRRGNLHHDPTMRPGLGSARCPRCLSLLNPTKRNSEWKITPVLHDATAVAGSGIGGLLSAVHGFNTGIPYVQKHVKGPKWLPFLIGLPPLLMFSAACSAFGGYALPRFTQLTVTSYYGTSSASHYGISLITRYIEEDHVSRIQHKDLR